MPFARMELFRFSLYVFFPMGIMLHYGNPDWYEKWVEPYKNSFLRTDKPQIKPPQTTEELHAALDRLKEERMTRHKARLQAGGEATRI